MRFQHPRTVSDAYDGTAAPAIDLGIGTVTADDDGVYEANVTETALDRLAAGYNVDGDDLVVDGSPASDATPTPDDPATAIENGECPWCDDYEGGHVGQHASSAHAEEWAAYQEG